MRQTFAPIAFFTYKRPDKTLRSLESLANSVGAKESSLFIFCDGPKSADDQDAVYQTRQVVKSRQWCREVYIIEEEVNKGLAQSIINGVTYLTEEFERVIVLEDDLLVSSGFIDYMNRALEKYCLNEQVMQISAHNFPVRTLIEGEDAFFLSMITSWGWATWGRAWRYFDPLSTGFELLRYDTDLRKRFDLDGHYPYASMLLAQMSGKVDSWAIKWWWSVFQNQGVSLYPKASLVRNIGFDSGATHSSRFDIYYDPYWSDGAVVGQLPDEIHVNQYKQRQIQKYLSRAMKPSLSMKIYRRLGRFMRFIF